jgi:hypothetical protein
MEEVRADGAARAGAAMGPGARGPATDAERLRAARQAAYGPDATPGGIRRLHELQAELTGAAAPSPAVEAAPAALEAAPPPRHGVVPLLAAVAVVAAAAGAAAGWTAGASTRPAPAPAVSSSTGEELLQRRILDSPGLWSAEDYFRLYPGDLPPDWIPHDDDGRSFLQLTGDTTIPLAPAAGTTVLYVVPTCPTSDRRFSWVLRAADGGEVGAAIGRCGRLDGTSLRIPADRGPFTLRVSTAGPTGYAVSVFER